MDNYKDLMPSRIDAIVLSDTPQAERPNALRVCNTGGAAATLVVKAANSKNSIILTFPPNTVRTEPGQFDTIFVTGSTPLAATFAVHGYYDIPRQ